MWYSVSSLRSYLLLLYLEHISEPEVLFNLYLGREVQSAFLWTHTLMNNVCAPPTELFAQQKMNQNVSKIPKNQSMSYTAHYKIRFDGFILLVSCPAVVRQEREWLSATHLLTSSLVYDQRLGIQWVVAAPEPGVRVNSCICHRLPSSFHLMGCDGSGPCALDIQSCLQFCKTFDKNMCASGKTACSFRFLSLKRGTADIFNISQVWSFIPSPLLTTHTQGFLLLNVLPHINPPLRNNI